MIYFYLNILIILIFAPTRSEEKWINLFNGEDLTGWIPKIAGYPSGENFAETFRVKDSTLRVVYDGYDQFNDRFGHLFYKESFSHYILKLEYRFTGDQVSGGPEWALRNSGVMFHAQHPETMDVDQSFPVCLEAQFLGGTGTGERPTGNLCTPGTNVETNGSLITDHCISSSSMTYHGDQWVSARLVVLGDSIIRHIIEGDTVITYGKPVIGGSHLPVDFPVEIGTPLKKGYIALQSESHPVEFRRIELLDLSE